MEDLKQLANYIKERNATEGKITELINRPAAIGHIGEYIASKIFNITLEDSASHKGSDGRFGDGPLKGRTVNVKWYAKREGLLDVHPDEGLDFYLVLTGPKSKTLNSKGQIRPWLIEAVFLFDARQLREAGIKTGVASSVKQKLWEGAEIYPRQNNNQLKLSQEQRDLLGLFAEKLKSISAG